MMESMSYRINSDVNSIPGAVALIINDVKRLFCFCSDDCIFSIKVVLNEIITNAAVHGNKCDCRKYVQIELLSTDNDVKFIVKDEGPCFTHQPDSLNDLLSENNRGIMICRHMCSSLEHIYREGAGNTVIITFKGKVPMEK
jgi:serine/threonine-protein kinase RsbW